MCSRASAPSGGNAVKVATEMFASYPTPPHSTIAWLGDFEIRRPRRKAIMRLIIWVPSRRITACLRSGAIVFRTMARPLLGSEQEIRSAMLPRLLMVLIVLLTGASAEVPTYSVAGPNDSPFIAALRQ